MDAFTRKLALRNAAKVAFGSLFFGCGGTMVSASEPPDALPDAPAAPDAAFSDVVAADAALACTGPTEVDAGNVSEETFQCCIGVVSSDVGDASPWESDGGEIASDPSAANCCSAIVARVDDEPDGGNVSGDYLAASNLLPWCCRALGYPMGPACTPWGPPMPPPMAAFAMEVA